MLDFECKSLQKVPLFRDMDPRSMQLIAFAANRVSFQSGETVFERGTVGDAMYIVVDGEVESFVRAPDGREVRLARFGPGNSFGEISLLNNCNRFLVVRAVGAVTLLEICKNDFLELTRAIPQFAQAVMRDLARRLDLMIEKYAAQPPA